MLNIINIIIVIITFLLVTNWFLMATDVQILATKFDISNAFVSNETPDVSSLSYMSAHLNFQKHYEASAFLFHVANLFIN
jgi:hypothetical protein